MRDARTPIELRLPTSFEELAASDPLGARLAALGIDVTLLRGNLAMTPTERLARADAQQRFAEDVRARLEPTAVQQAREKARLWEKIEALGGPDPAWPTELRDGR